jgi:hypothetical protein
MSDSSQFRLTRLATRETVYRTPIASAGLVVRRTGGAPAITTTLKQSAEVRTDLQSTQAFRTNLAGTLKIDDEWVYDGHNRELEDVFLAPFGTIITSSATAISASSIDNSFNRAAGSFIADGIVVGQPIKTGGFAAAADNVVCRAVTVTATKITTNATLVTEAAGVNSLVAAAMLRMGTTDMWTTFEGYYPDVATLKYIVYPGAVAVGWQYKFSHPGEMMCSFDYNLPPPLAAAATGANNGTITPYTANTVMTSVDHFKLAQEGGSPLAAWVKDFTLDVKNPKREIGSAGTLGAKKQGKSTFAVTGSIVVYNDDAGLALYNKHIAGAYSSFEFEMVDDLGNIQHLWVGKLKYSGGAPSDGPKDSDITITLPFDAVQDPTTGTVVQLSKFS